MGRGDDESPRRGAGPAGRDDRTRVRMVLKLQKSIYPEGLVLAYNEDRSFLAQMEAPPTITFRKGELKFYAECEVIFPKEYGKEDPEIEVIKRVPEEYW